MKIIIERERKKQTKTNKQNKKRKEQRGDASYSESVRTK